MPSNLHFILKCKLDDTLYCLHIFRKKGKSNEVSSSLRFILKYKLNDISFGLHFLFLKKYLF